MPKRPATAFMLFVNSKRAEIKENNPDAKVTDIGRIAGQMWKELTDEQKKVGFFRKVLLLNSL